MGDRDLRLSLQLCNEIFPFHLVLDEKLHIVRISDKFLKLVPNFRKGQSFQKFLISEEDEGLLTWDQIDKRINVGYVFKSTEATNLRFRVGFYLTEPDSLLLVASPIISKSEDIMEASLSFDDFASHDTILEHISVVQTKDSMFKDSRAFADRLEKMIEERTSELRKSREKLNEAQRIGGLGSWVMNVRTGKASWSDERFRIFGYEPGEVEANFENFKRNLHPDDLERVVLELEKASKNREKFDSEYRIFRPNGEMRNIHAIGEFVGSDDTLSGTVMDITERKQAEEKILSAMQKAEFANRAKSSMLANMSHELRTPLNAIIGFSSTMIEETFGPLGDEKYREYLSDIHQSGSHLLNLINDILDISAIEADALELQEEHINTTEIVDVSIRLIAPRAKDGDVKLSSQIDPKIPLIYADSRRVKQVLLNLLSNAVKFTPEEGEVSVSSKLNDNGSLAIAVRDNGIGMNEDEVKHAMSKFGQLDTSLYRKHEGTGLGLPLTKGLMELHNGAMEIHSKKGQGTMITVTFPKERVIHSL